MSDPKVYNNILQYVLPGLIPLIPDQAPVGKITEMLGGPLTESQVTDTSPARFGPCASQAQEA